MIIDNAKYCYIKNTADMSNCDFDHRHSLFVCPTSSWLHIT